MKVFAVCSLKGGVGKTSVVLGLASAAMNRSLRCLVVDLDPQADATMALDVTLPPGHEDVAAVIDGPGIDVIGRAIIPSGWDEEESIEVMAGSMRSAAHDSPDPPPESMTRLARALGQVASHYDLALIDCPPSLSGLTRMGIAAATRAIVVTEPGLFAVAAADRALTAIHDLRRQGLGVQPLGIVINRVRTHTKEHAFRVGELGAMFGPLLLAPVIPERSAIQQAQGALRPIHSWPGATATDLSGRFDALLERALRAPRPSAPHSAGPGQVPPSQVDAPPVPGDGLPGSRLPLGRALTGPAQLAGSPLS